MARKKTRANSTPETRMAVLQARQERLKIDIEISKLRAQKKALKKT
jgi:hypothetical protein